MPDNILLKNISQYVNAPVKLDGWLYNKRSSGKIIFLQFRDGTGVVQAIALKNKLEAKAWKQAGDITIESSVEVIG